MDTLISWFTPRTYLHFDLPLPESPVKQFVIAPENVGRYAFFPFISFDVKSRKVAYDSEKNHIFLKNKVRPIAYAAHMDSHIYSYYSSMLSCLYEDRLRVTNLSNNVLAFRKLHKGNIEFADEVFKEIRKFGNCHVVALDIEEFFKKIHHETLRKAWCDLVNLPRLPADHFAVFKSLTQYRTVNRTKLYQTFGISLRNPYKHGCKYRICDGQEFREQVRPLVELNPNPFGIPQGSPISALLSNIYLMKFDALIVDNVNKAGGRYFRYCDDIFIIVPENPNQLVSLTTEALKSFNLTINAKKKEIRQFFKVGSKQSCDKPIQYLGFLFDGQKVLIRPAALAKFSIRMKKAVFVAKASMHKLNLIRAKRGETPQKMYRRKLYEKFSYLGSRNFVAYGYRAASIMNSSAIRKQLKPLWPRLLKEIGQS